jgi:hypothetical protein
MEKSISELKNLAILTLSYAAQEEPSSVGPRFDLMTLDRNSVITWSVEKPIRQKFQDGLERLFLECSKH